MSLINKELLLFSDSYRITDKISVRHPVLQDIISYGCDKYFHIVGTLTSIPSDAISLLNDEAHLDWQEIPDLQFFAMLTKGLTAEETQVFLPNIDFKNFSYIQKQDGDFVYIDVKNDIVIDEYVYRKLSECLCTMHKITKKPIKAANAITKQWIIEDDREKRRLAKLKTDKESNSLIPLISSMVNRAEFKYDYKTVMAMPFGQFMDAATRVQVIVSTDKLINGIYAGNVDASKISQKQLDWTREI